jgi:hypothetical protein
MSKIAVPSGTTIVLTSDASHLRELESESRPLPIIPVSYNRIANSTLINRVRRAPLPPTQSIPPSAPSLPILNTTNQLLVSSRSSEENPNSAHLSRSFSQLEEDQPNISLKSQIADLHRDLEHLNTQEITRIRELGLQYKRSEDLFKRGTYWKVNITNAYNYFPFYWLDVAINILSYPIHKIAKIVYPLFSLISQQFYVDRARQKIIRLRNKYAHLKESSETAKYWAIFEKHEKELIETNNRINRKVNSYKFKIGKKSVELIKKPVDWLLKTAEHAVVKVVKTGIEVWEEGKEIQNVEKRKRLQQQWIKDLNSPIVDSEEGKKYDDFLRGLIECHSLQEWHLKLTERGLHVDMPFKEWKNKIKTPAYQKEFLHLCQTAGLFSSSFTHSPGLLGLELEAEKIHHIQGLLEKRRDALKAGVEAWMAQMQHQEISGIKKEFEKKGILLSQVGPSLDSWDAINEKLKDGSFQNLVYTRFLEHSQSIEKQLKVTLKELLLKKQKQEQKMPLYQKIQAQIYVAAKILELILYIPAIKELAFANQFLVPLVTNFAFPGSGLLYFFAPTLATTAIGCGLMLFDYISHHWDKSLEHNWKTLVLNIQIYFHEWYYALYKFCHDYLYFARIIHMKVIDQVARLFLEKGVCDLEQYEKEVEERFKENEKLYKEKIRDLKKQLLDWEWKDFISKHFKNSSSINGDLYLSILQQAMESTQPNLFSDEAHAFFKSHLGIDLRLIQNKEDAGAVMDQIKEFFCQDYEQKLNFYAAENEYHVNDYQPSGIYTAYQALLNHSPSWVRNYLEEPELSIS